VALSRGAVEFRDLTFAYAAGHAPVLKNINLVIPPGRVCGIVGETGSGKSTLVSLLLRLFEPPDGTVFVDGADIKRLPVAEVEAAVGLVSQDIFLFGTIHDNILFGVDASMGKSPGAAGRSTASPSSPSAISSKPPASWRPPGGQKTADRHSRDQERAIRPSRCLPAWTETEEKFPGNRNGL
jgi:ABC-type sugar transport system ATPase subunit